jgi:hypothetical protein
VNFYIDVSSISHCIDNEVPGFDIEDYSISYWFDIECYNLRYRRFSEVRHSISILIIECQNLRYRVVISYLISKVIFRPSISKVAPPISLYKDIEGPTFDIEGRQGSRCAPLPDAAVHRACSASLSGAGGRRRAGVRGSGVHLRVRRVLRQRPPPGTAAAAAEAGVDTFAAFSQDAILKPCIASTWPGAPPSVF